MSWWPFRRLQEQGLHPLWSTVAIYLVAAAAVALVRPRALAEVARTPSLWVLVLAAGSTNAAFNWGVSVGEVVRVVLLFYLMPLWAVLLAWLLLREKPTAAVLLRVLVALVGALIVLWPVEAGGGLRFAMPLPRTLGDWLGVIGGFTFALNNVMLRRESHRSEEGRAMAMFVGGIVVAGGLAALLAGRGRVDWPALPSAGWLLVTLVLGGLFLLGNMALQYGAARLSANATAVVMLSEVVFAAGSAALLGGEAPTLPVVFGGVLILAAAALATLSPSTKIAAHEPLTQPVDRG